MGVKSLWSLLTPVGRPVMLETMEGKSMAIDSSIWIYQFQATMRDKDGRVLVNAHVVGFLRRICKLLFHGIRPVFVFDGGAPALKRSTIAERKRKKAGAADSHAKLAERLLAAQMRREALNHVQASSKGKGRDTDSQEETVYLEDIDSSMPKAPRTEAKERGENSPASANKSRWRDYDPYKLPDVDIKDVMAKATRARVPDPRLATEEELQAIIDHLRPEDLDMTSDAFRDLPTEVQYEIIGDLRLKSRQPSHRRLQEILKVSKTPMDFSKAQIRGVKQRADLTQQLLETTDSVGKAHLPNTAKRIASERDREYVLVRNENAEGGWILGIRDDGTAEKPIVIDKDDDEPDSEPADDDSDMEEVEIPAPVPCDPDLREYRRELSLSGVAKRQTSSRLRPRREKEPVNPTNVPLFIPESSDEDDGGSDMELVAAIQNSLEQKEAEDLQKAINVSIIPGTPPKQAEVAPGPGSVRDQPTMDSDDDLYYTPSRLETALSFANTRRESDSAYVNTIRTPTSSQNTSPKKSSPEQRTAPPQVDMPSPSPKVSTKFTEHAMTIDDIGMLPSDSDSGMEELEIVAQAPPTRQEPLIQPQSSTPTIMMAPQADENSLEKTNEVALTREVPPLQLLRDTSAGKDLQNDRLDSADNDLEGNLREVNTIPVQPTPEETLTPVAHSLPNALDTSGLFAFDSDEGEHWSRSPSPIGDGAKGSKGTVNDDHWDAAHEMDASREEGEFARFVSQVKGKDINSVQKEIDEEIRSLNQQRKAAMRDSEDVTQVMVTQIMNMLRLFGIPYITAPMEAEAQCAALVSLGIVDGIITDDSDVFLFGGERVFKNMFNQSKTVECFLLRDLDRELGLDRDKLVRLAYLLGSDYVEGLPGIGPVVAMELLNEFPGEDGLHKFKDWWLKVQSGRDKESDNVSTFRKRFKKRFKELYLPSDWPNVAVRDAYYHPLVDDSEEPFKWGLPDLDGLRGFLREELSWNVTKVDELLLPIIQKMSKRGQANATNKQGTLVGFLDVSSGSGTLAPRRQQAYTSKRLQQLVTQHRKEQAKRKADSDNTTTTTSAEPSADSSGDEVSISKVKTKKATKRVKRGDSLRKDAQSATAETSSKRTTRAKTNRKTTRGSGKGSQKQSVTEGVVSSSRDRDPVTKRPKRVRLTRQVYVDRDDGSVEGGNDSSDEYHE